jgi:hypothetical protein
MHGKIQVIGTVTDGEHLVFPGVDPIHIEDLADAFNRLTVPPPLGEHVPEAPDTSDEDVESGESGEQGDPS